jgi:hypothetical protein
VSWRFFRSSCNIYDNIAILSSYDNIKILSSNNISNTLNGDNITVLVTLNMALLYETRTNVPHNVLDHHLPMSHVDHV